MQIKNITSTSKSRNIFKLFGICVLASIVLAAFLFPAAGGIGFFAAKISDNINSTTSQLISGDTPEQATVTDADGNVIAHLITQNRIPVSFDQISPNMIKAIISIEDRRFLEHGGIDIRGTLRALVKNYTSGQIEQGASTLDQQYVKNFQLLVLATNEQEREEAIATTPARKLREARMAIVLEDTLTNELKARGMNADQANLEVKRIIVTRYLNLVSFGNSVFGIEAAAKYYFNTTAKDLTIPQAAMLAGMVQQASVYNPYSNPKGVLARRNVVLDSMSTNFPSEKQQYLDAKKTSLGVVPQGSSVSNTGCISSENDGFFCAYTLQFLQQEGLNINDITRYGMVIKTTLDPKVQDQANKIIKSVNSPHDSDIATVMNILKPGTKSHDILAMVDSRNYGLDSANDQTSLAEPYSLVGDGGGSTFKIFTTTAAMMQGMGSNVDIDVPAKVGVNGMGAGGEKDCPGYIYCVKNDGKYQPYMSLTKALATSPNTAFVGLIKAVGVSNAVDMAVKLGLRSYATPGTSTFTDQSLADYIKTNNLASFTLGPFPVNDLELSNVATTLASHGMWCPPNPIREILIPEKTLYGTNKIQNGQLVYKKYPVPPQICQQVVPSGLADSLANALKDDHLPGGTSASSAANAGWIWPISTKTGTTETSRSATFVGFTPQFAGAVYTFADKTPVPLCSYPLRTCVKGDLYGGDEPAEVFYKTMAPLVKDFGTIDYPTPDPKYVDGTTDVSVPQVIGMGQGDATSTLSKAGFYVNVATGFSDQPVGAVIGEFPPSNVNTYKNALVTIVVSSGAPPPPKVTLPIGPIIVLPGQPVPIPGQPGLPGQPNQPGKPVPPGI